MRYGVLAISYRPLGALLWKFLSVTLRSKKSRPKRTGFLPKYSDKHENIHLFQSFTILVKVAKGTPQVIEANPLISTPPAEVPLTNGALVNGTGQNRSTGCRKDLGIIFLV
jgi:hypothetical protein